MNKKFLLKLVIKNLLARKMRTILTMLGIAISIGFISMLVSFGLGLQRISTSEITDLEALQVLDVTIGKSKLVSITDEEISKFELLGKVELVVPHFQVATKMEFNDSSINGITYGKMPESLPLEDLKVIKGEEKLQRNSLIITSSALKQLGVKDFANVLGKKITLTLVPKKGVLEEAKNEDEKKMTFSISGVLEENDSQFVYINLENLKEAGFKKYDGAKIKMISKEDVSIAKQKLESMGFKVTTIKETIDQINQFFSLFQMILVILGTIAIIVSSIGMFNTLTINLLEKTREVGFMKVLGTTKKDIYHLFLGESIVIGFIGGVVGVITSYLIGLFSNVTIASMAKRTGNKPVEIFYMPFIFILIIIISVVIVSVVTGFWPSRKASRTNPLDALRYE